MQRLVTLAVATALAFAASACRTTRGSSQQSSNSSEGVTDGANNYKSPSEIDRVRNAFNGFRM